MPLDVNVQSGIHRRLRGGAAAVPQTLLSGAFGDLARTEKRAHLRQNLIRRVQGVHGLSVQLGTNVTAHAERRPLSAGRALADSNLTSRAAWPQAK